MDLIRDNATRSYRLTFREFEEIFSDYDIADRVKERVFGALDENSDGYLDFIDFAWTYDTYLRDQEVYALLGIEEGFSQPNGSFQIYSPREICLPEDKPVPDGAQECPVDLLSETEAIQALSLYRSLCLYLATDPFLNPFEERFAFCQREDPTVKRVNIQNKDRGSDQDAQEPVRAGQRSDPGKVSPLIVENGSVLVDFNKNPGLFNKLLFGMYDDVIGNEEIEPPVKEKILDELESQMEDPSGHVIEIIVE